MATIKANKKSKNYETRDGAAKRVGGPKKKMKNCTYRIPVELAARVSEQKHPSAFVEGAIRFLLNEIDKGKAFVEEIKNMPERKFNEELKKKGELY